MAEIASGDTHSKAKSVDSPDMSSVLQGLQGSLK